MSRPKVESYLDSCTKYIKQNRPDKVIQYNLRAEEIVDSLRIDDYDVRYDIEYNYSWAFRITQKNDLAIQRIKKIGKLIQESKKQGNERFIPTLFNINHLANYFSQTQQMDSAEKYYKKAYETAKAHNDSTYISGTLNNIGLFKMNQVGWDTAKWYFDKALETLSIYDDSDSSLYCSIKDNLADYYLYKGDSVRGINIIETNLNYLAFNAKTQAALIRWSIKLLKLYMSKAEYAKAQQLIPKIKKWLPAKEADAYFSNTIYLIDQELILDKMEKKGLLETDLLNKKINFLNDFLNFKIKSNQRSNKLLTEYMSAMADQQLKAAHLEMEAAKEKEKRKSLFLVISIVVSVFMILLIVTNYRRRLKIIRSDKQIKEQELQIERLEKDKISLQLEDKSKDFSKLFMQTNLLQEWGSEVSERLKAIRKLSHEESDDEIKQLLLELRQKTGTYEKILLQQKGLNEANSNFFRQLEEQFPTLSKAEKETCGLIRMNLDGKEIAMIRNIHPSSVRKLRQRIRSKLNLSAETDLYDFIQKL